MLRKIADQKALLFIMLCILSGCEQKLPIMQQPEKNIILPPDNFIGLVRLIDHPGNDKYPEASPDGRLVVYSAKKGKTSDIFYFNPFSKRINVVQITRHIAEDNDPTWSADGKYIYFTSARLKTLSIWKTKIKGGRGLNQITLRENVDDFDPSLSPDGKKLVFTSRNPRNKNFFGSQKTSDPTMWVASTEGYRVVQIGTGNNPKWSPNGKKIIFHAKTGDNYDIWTINSDGTNLTQLTTDSADDKDPAWSPDGTMVIFSSNREGTFKTRKNFDLWAIDLESTGITQLTFDPADDGGPFWSKDGTVYFHSNRGTKDNTYDIFSGKPIIDWNKKK